MGRAYVTTAVPKAVSAHQTSAMPDDVAKVFQDLTVQYEAEEAIESRVAHDADKIETPLQAVEYQAQGHDTAAWRETSASALRTDSAQQLAQATGSADPHGWWSASAASYRELRASTRGKGAGSRRLSSRPQAVLWRPLMPGLCDLTTDVRRMSAS